MTEKDIEKFIEKSLLGELTPEEDENLSRVLLDKPDLLKKWQDLKSIACLAAEVKAVEPPADLKARVLSRLSEAPGSRLDAVWEFLFRPRTASIDLVKAFSGNVSRPECSFYYLMGGLYYLIISLILMIGLNKLDPRWAAVTWIKLQPYISLFTALWLGAMGVALLKNGQTAIRVAYQGSLLLIGFFIVNGIAIHVTAGFPIALVFLFSLVGTGIVGGLFLLRIVYNYRKCYATT
ncbi:MAG: hypothetical protein NTV99_04420 [Deltaproteobacteria bacterium]|nr:hypothetical protein [Deltaproteobacteria bacterium]